ncbi:hypothetical protein LOTGIDRAFT_206771 [Lottia gigantea]|uniref:Probable imidazolonepropionase n=1 Tax=Lottia gigantea TaxID=225164 RepID=V3ZFH4_LOTGI|nr:hypothetical protein LOTGIDRAFT_206771 [Lottia gigantea]ESO89893.1 hypothetical protein LOTGIDRAFT_206771 [Lottia gigantea]
MSKYKLLIQSASQIVQVVDNGARMLYGLDMKHIAVLESTDQGYSIIIDNDGRIHDIDLDDVINKKYKEDTFHHVINARGKSIIPGFVDAHTHPVWAGDRVHEFEMKLGGASYMDVHEAGGGINFTVEKTREADEEELYSSFEKRLKCMREAGTTLVECKSGYGLDTENEIKMLHVIERGRRNFGIDISSTYCGAHAVPKGKTAEEATKDVIDSQIPAIQKLRDQKKLHVDNIDVFCEKGVFNLDQSRNILLAGKTNSLQINFHGDELFPLHSAEMGAEIDATAISHLEEISVEGMKAMAKSKTIGVILPTTAYILRLPLPPVRSLIEHGVPVALGTDFNPNAYCCSMPLVMHLACVLMKMTLTEALVAATINSSASLGLSQDHGSIEIGKLGNLLILDTTKWQHLIYQLGCHDQVIESVIWHGDIVHRRHERQ